MNQSAEERFAAKLDLTAPNGCWEWTASKVNGYGFFWLDGRNHRAHRVSYEMLAGPIPDGLHLDHLCRNRACVNPAHLEPVTMLENIQRGDHYGKGATNRNKTHCPHGHEYGPENTYHSKTAGRICRACWRTRRHRRRARSALAQPPDQQEGQ